MTREEMKAWDKRLQMIAAKKRAEALKKAVAEYLDLLKR
jgi:hypothetical protein